MEGVLWLLIYAGLFYFMMRYGCGAHMVHGHGGHGSEGGTSHGGHGSHEGPGRGAETGNTDPVCGMDVAADSGYSRMYEGRQYRFCSRKCLDKFDADPAGYAK